MPPKFSLQAVLDYRHKRVEMLESELAQLLLAQQKARAFLDTLNESLNLINEQIAASQEGDVDLFMAAQLRSNFKVVTDYIAQQKTFLQDLAEKIQDKQAEFIKARQEEEALKKLSDKERERYEEEQAMQEKRTQDDIYIARAYRNTVQFR